MTPLPDRIRLTITQEDIDMALRPHFLYTPIQIALERLCPYRRIVVFADETIIGADNPVSYQNSYRMGRFLTRWYDVRELKPATFIPATFILARKKNE